MGLVELAQLLDKKSAEIELWDAVIHIGYANSADALIGACILGRTLLKLEKPFSLFHSRDMTGDIVERKGQYYIFVGHQGAELHDINDQIEYLALVYPTDTDFDDERIINPLSFELTYPEISLGAMAYLLCDPLIPQIRDIVTLPLVAQQTIAMKSQPRGIHQRIFELAEENDLISEQTTLGILGSDVFSISDALVYSQDPFLPNITDNEDRVIQLLAKADVVAETSEGARKFSDLSDDEIKKLNIVLIEYLTQHSGYRDSELNFIRKKTEILTEEQYTILHNTWDFARGILDAINRNNHNLAAAVLLGNRSGKLRELTKLYKEERHGLTTSFNLIKDRYDEVIELKNLRYLETEHKVNWYNTSLITAMALSSGLVTIDQPFAVIAPGPAEYMTIGVRASKQIDLDVGLMGIASQLCEELGIEARLQGESHKMMISLPPASVKDFIFALNDKLGDIQ